MTPARSRLLYTHHSTFGEVLTGQHFFAEGFGVLYKEGERTATRTAPGTDQAQLLVFERATPVRINPSDLQPDFSEDAPEALPPLLPPLVTPLLRDLNTATNAMRRACGQADWEGLNAATSEARKALDAIQEAYAEAIAAHQYKHKR